MKTTIAILLFCAVSYQAAAQTALTNEQRLINRADHQLGSGSSIRIIADPQSAITSFSVDISEPRIVFTAGDYVSFHGTMVNKTNEVLQMNFYRYQTLPADEWSSSVCFGTMCYLHTIDSLPPGQYYEFEPGAMNEFKVNVSSAPGKTDSIVMYLRVAAMNTTAGDTIGFWLVGVAEYQQGVVSNTSRNSVRISSVYPSPMVSGSVIRASVTVPKETSYSYSIYDTYGREVAFGTTRQQLTAGDNTVEIGSLEGLASGSYLLRMNFGGLGSDAVSFNVIR